MDEKFHKFHDLLTKHLKSKDVLEHCERLMLYAAIYEPSDLYSYSAFCHDLLEDSDCTYEEIVEIDKEVADIVLILTRREREVYKDYIRRVKDSGNNVAKRIKVLDIMDHLANFETLPNSLLIRYIKALVLLLGKEETHEGCY